MNGELYVPGKAVEGEVIFPPKRQLSPEGAIREGFLPRLQITATPIIDAPHLPEVEPSHKQIEGENE